MTRLPQIAAALLFHGRGANTPVAVIAQGTLPEEKVVVSTLGTIAGDVASAGLKAPATIVVGEVVRMRERLRGVRSVFHELPQSEAEEGEELPGQVLADRLFYGYQTVRPIVERYDGKTASAWLFGMNPWFGDEAPAYVLRHSDRIETWETVIHAAQDFAEFKP